MKEVSIGQKIGEIGEERLSVGGGHVRDQLPSPVIVPFSFDYRQVLTKYTCAYMCMYLNIFNLLYRGFKSTEPFFSTSQEERVIQPTVLKVFHKKSSGLQFGTSRSGIIDIDNSLLNMILHGTRTQLYTRILLTNNLNANTQKHKHP